VKELRLLPADSLDSLAGLVFELAAQLHVERVRRAALETVLERRGLCTPDELASLADDPSFAARCQPALDRSLEGLLRVLAERDDARAPLRGTSED
jgi:hypothetical protein